MKQKNLIIGGAIFLILGYFGYQSYQSIETQNSKFEKVEKKSGNLREQTGNASSNSQKEKMIFKFRSNSNDLENKTRILQTNNEMSYHTFDLANNLITYKSKNKYDEWVTFDFKIKKSSIKTSLIGLKGAEFEIDNPNCYQIWVSTLGNIGYEFSNGQKLVFYGVEDDN